MIQKDIIFFKLTRIIFQHPIACNIVGEDLTDTYIVVKRRAVCLQIPTVEFAVKPPLKAILKHLKSIAVEAVPTSQTVFSKYKTEQKWQKYKDSVMSEVYNNNKIKKRGTSSY